MSYLTLAESMKGVSFPLLIQPAAVYKFTCNKKHVNKKQLSERTLINYV